MNLTILSDDELYKLAAHQYAYNTDIHEEWLRRFGLFFPYKLIDDQIYNCILGITMQDNACDKLVFQQAEVLRSKRAKTMTNNDVFL